MPSQHERIIEIVTEFPGLVVSEIRELLDLEGGRVSARLSELVKSGKLKRESGQYFIGDGEPLVLKKEPSKKDYNALARIAALEEALADALTWQTEAIKRFPDLAVKPEVLAARKVAAKYYEDVGDTKMVRAITLGAHDNAPVVQIALRAMTT